MKVILREDIEKLGQAGELVTVKDGYGRNFLIPQAKAVLATKGAIAELELMKQRAAQKAALTVQEAKELATKLESTSLTISSSFVAALFHWRFGLTGVSVVE